MTASHHFRRFFGALAALMLFLVGCGQPQREALPTQPAPPAPAERPDPDRAPLPPTAAPSPAAPTPLPSPTPPRPPTATAAPSARLAEAREAERIGDWERAFPLYESLRDDPQHAHAALFYLGDLYLRDDRMVEAATTWQQALLVAPDGPFAAPIRYRLARGLAAIGQHASAIEMLTEFDRANDTVEDVVAQRLAESYAARGQQEAVVAQWERLYEWAGTPRVTRALTARELGDWHAAAGRWADALTWYERTLDLSVVESYRAEILLEMAAVAVQQSNPTQARTLWRTVLDEYPGEPAAPLAADRLAAVGEPLTRFQMGELYFANERWGEAARAFFASLEQESDRAEAHHLAAQALEANGDAATALREWQKILDTHLEAPALHAASLLGVGRMQAELGQVAESLATLERVATEYPDSEAAPDALWARAVVLRDALDDSSAAAAAFERLASDYPEAVRAEDALWQAGMAWLEADQPARAQEALTRLAQREGERPTQALFWAGKAAQAAGDAAAAKDLWAAAVEWAPHDYYALRAAALLQGERWQPRTAVSIVRPPTDEQVSWLREAADLPMSADLLALPDELAFERGELLLLMGERELAGTEFRAAIQARREEPQALWAMAHEFRALHQNSLSILAAQRLMEQLDYTPQTVPLALGELLYPLPFEVQLRDAATPYGYDPLFFAAMIYQESRWEPRARSSAAARGLTQVIPDTATWIAQRIGDRQYRYRDLDRPLISLHYGSYYLDYVLDLFDQNPYHALAAYNGGPGNARRWIGPDDDQFVEDIALRESRNYVEWVYEHWHAYARIYRP